MILGGVSIACAPLALVRLTFSFGRRDTVEKGTGGWTILGIIWYPVSHFLSFDSLLSAESARC